MPPQIKNAARGGIIKMKGLLAIARDPQREGPTRQMLPAAELPVIFYLLPALKAREVLYAGHK